jgi:hypothetical protein
LAVARGNSKQSAGQQDSFIPDSPTEQATRRDFHSGKLFLTHKRNCERRPMLLNRKMSFTAAGIGVPALQIKHLALRVSFALNNR